LLFCVLISGYCVWFAIKAYRTGTMRTGFGQIERSKKPAQFWMLIIAAMFAGPLLIFASVTLIYFANRP